MKNKRRQYKYSHRYGMSVKTYDVLLEDQNNCCSICNSKTPKRNLDYFVVDHNHETKEIRGLLCDSCNKGLGHFYDNVETLKNAIKYLENNTRISYIKGINDAIKFMEKK